MRRLSNKMRGASLLGSALQPLHSAGDAGRAESARDREPSRLSTTRRLGRALCGRDQGRKLRRLLRQDRADPTWAGVFEVVGLAKMPGPELERLMQELAPGAVVRRQCVRHGFEACSPRTSPVRRTSTGYRRLQSARRRLLVATP